MRYRSSRSWGRAALILLAAGGPGLVADGPAADPRPMTAVDLIEVPRLSDPQLSPDGMQILYTRSEASWKANRDIRHVYRVNADGTGLRPMTSGAEGESSPRWSPDGRRFAFLAKPPGAE